MAEVEAAARDWLVLHGECVEFGGEELAYAPVVAALRDLPADWLDAYLDELSAEARGALAAVLPREAPGGGGPGRLYELLLDLLGRLAAERAPVLLVLEDIHWADRSTLALLAFLARNLRSERIVVLATYRVDDELLGRAAAARGRAFAAPDGAADRARAARARRRRAPARGDRRRPGAGRAGARAARAGGRQPVLRRGAVRGAHARRWPRRCWRGSSGSTARRWRRSPRPAGERRYTLLERLDVDPDALRAALDAGVLVRERDGVAFRHGLIGEVVYERLLPAERARLHRAIAGALDDAAQRAHHCHRAGLRAEALGGVGEAGIEAARVFAYAEARRALRTRARAVGDDDESTASSCSPAPPRPRASAATPSGPSRAAARRSR